MTRSPAEMGQTSSAAMMVPAMTGLALGPRQLGGFNPSGTVALDGLSLGLEASW